MVEPGDINDLSLGLKSLAYLSIATELMAMRIRSTTKLVSAAIAVAPWAMMVPQVRAQVKAPNTCVGYDTILTLHGTLVKRAFPTGAGFRSDTVLALRLEAPIATCPTNGHVSRSVESHTGLVELQLVLFATREIDSMMTSVQGRAVAIQGRLEESTLVHEHTPVLLDAEVLLLPDGSTRDVRPIPSRPRWDTPACSVGPAPEISVRHIGAVALDASVNALRRDIPSHADARWPVSPDSESRAMDAHLLPGDYAAINFYVECFDLNGTQLRDTLDPNAAFRLWSVMGARGTLPRGLSLHATWRELRAAYGDRFTIDGRGTVRFCSLPGFGFDLRGYRWMYPPEGPRPTPSPEAEIWDVLISPFDSTSSCDG